jgi:hypothetical protein
MFSKAIPGGHGNQACYDMNGILIETTIAAGRAKKFAPVASEYSNRFSHENHNEEDITPFIRAAQLDGNPVRPFSHDETATTTYEFEGKKYSWESTRQCSHENLSLIIIQAT